MQESKCRFTRLVSQFTFFWSVNRETAEVCEGPIAFIHPLFKKTMATDSGQKDVFLMTCSDVQVELTPQADMDQ